MMTKEPINWAEVKVGKRVKVTYLDSTTTAKGYVTAMVMDSYIEMDWKRHYSCNLLKVEVVSEDEVPVPTRIQHDPTATWLFREAVRLTLDIPNTGVEHPASTIAIWAQINFCIRTLETLFDAVNEEGWGGSWEAIVLNHHRQYRMENVQST